MKKNIIRTLVFALLMITGFNSLANSSNQPTPVDNFTFADGKKLWDQGVMPDENKLIGTWNNIAWGDLSFDFAGVRNYYIESGYVNSDGSHVQTVFGWREKDAISPKRFYAQFLHLGSIYNNQGPFVAHREPTLQSLRTSRYIWISDGLPTQSYFIYDCRQISRQEALLVCGITLKIAPSERSRVAKECLIWDGVMAGMAVFQKVSER